jgi:hypothetical protein
MPKSKLEKGVERAIKAAKQLHQKRGEYYERWKAGIELSKGRRKKEEK